MLSSAAVKANELNLIFCNPADGSTRVNHGYALKSYTWVGLQRVRAWRMYLDARRQPGRDAGACSHLQVYQKFSTISFRPTFTGFQ